MKKIVAGKQLWNYDNLEPVRKETGALRETRDLMATRRIHQAPPAKRGTGDEAEDETPTGSAAALCSRRR